MQNVQDCIKELNDLLTNPSSVDKKSILNKCIQSLSGLDKDTKKTLDQLQKQSMINEDIDLETISQLMKSLQINERKKEKTDLDKKQEWDMKKLYAEVFKLSYQRNQLKTNIEQVIQKQYFYELVDRFVL